MTTTRLSHTNKAELTQSTGAPLSKACRSVQDDSMVTRNQLPGVGVARYIRYMAVALFLLPSLALVDLSYAAGRVFYDGFEDGTTNKWESDYDRIRCTVVTSSTDGVAGPHTGSRMARCNMNGTVPLSNVNNFENLKLSSINYTNEIFYRARVRVDKNVERTNISPLKLLRIYYWTGDQSTYRDMFECFTPSNSLSNRGNAGAVVLNTYWGGASGDNSASTSAWHEVEYYFNHANGAIKVWHDGVLVRNDTVNFNSRKWLPFHIASNWSDSHDATNYVYFDEIEIYSDAGTGATGLMSNATVSASGSGSGNQTVPNAPENVQVILPQ